jgi:hypothetical protein
MQIEQARGIVKEFVSGWSTQKLCEVLAFAEDGKMNAYQSCQCLEGVASAEVLHEQHRCPSTDEHWKWHEKRGSDCLTICEYAYFSLGDETAFGDQKERDREMTEILRQVIAERESLECIQVELVESEVTQNG